MIFLLSQNWIRNCNQRALMRGFTLKITGVIVRSRTTQLLYIGVRKTPLGYGSENDRFQNKHYTRSVTERKC